MNPDDTQNPLPEQSANQQQSLGNVQVQGDDNTFNVIQAQVVTLTQTKIIQISVDEIKTRELIPSSPYKGLKKFEPEDSDRFFGRDQFIGGLVNELEQTNFVLLLGASGSGKSSVVRAGLVPWLQQTWGKQFVSLMFTPDRDPFESLYGSLLSRGFSQSHAQLAREGKTDTLIQVVNGLKSPESYWLIVIDQFEELFTVSEAKKRDSFINSLVKLSKDRASDATLKIVATMRADFLDQLDPAPANRLARLTEKHRPLITQMHPDELRLTIEQPAAHHGVVFETGLVEEIIKDVQGQAGYLPLLQYTLDLLWESEAQNGGLQDRALRSSSYRRLGGVRGALQQRVDEIYLGLSEPEQLAAQRIFLKLVEIGDDEAAGTGWKPVRRRAARAEFADEAEQRVLTQLINANLLVSDAPVEPVGQRQSAGQGATVEIAHEILLTSWTTLHGWIKQNRQAIALRNRLNDDVALWQTQKSDSDLWGGSKLAQVVELRQDQVFQQVLGGFSPGANQFIEASVGLRDRTRRRIFWSVIAVVSILSISTALATKFAVAERERKKDVIEALIERPRQLLETNNQLEALVESVVVLQKLDKIDGQNTKALLELKSVISEISERNRLESHEEPVNGVSFSHDGQEIASASHDGTIKIWNGNGKLLKTLSGHQNVVWQVEFNPVNDVQIASTSEDGTAMLWDLEEKQQPKILTHEDPVFGLSFSPNGNQIATSSFNEIRLWDVASGKLLQTFTDTDISQDGSIYGVDFSPDGTMLASSGYEDGNVKIWNLKTRQAKTLERDGQPLDPDPYNNIISSIRFSPNPQYSILAASSYDGTIKLWDFRSGKLIVSFRASNTYVFGIAFSPNGAMLASASRDKSVKLWDLQGNLMKTLKGHTFDVNYVDFSPDAKHGLMLASTSDDRTARLWRVDSDASLDDTTRPKELIEEICRDIQDYLETHQNLPDSNRKICSK